MAKQASANHRPKFTRWLFAAIAAGGLIVAVLHFGEVEKFLDMVRRAQPLWLLVGLALQLSTYGAVSLGWSATLAKAGSPQPLHRLFSVALIKLFADQALPGAGMGGNVVLIERLTALGVPRGSAVATLLVSLVGYYIAYAAVAVVMLLVLWLRGHATPLLVGMTTAFLLVALAVPSLALWLRARGTRNLPKWVERIGLVRKLFEIVGEAPKKLVSDRRLILIVTLCNGSVFLADSATLMVCLHALGQPLVPASAFIALVAASIVTTLGPIPMGLGSFEATSTATLAMLGVPVEAGVAATLLLRGLTLWLPMLPGMILLRTNLHRHPRRTQRKVSRR